MCEEFTFPSLPGSRVSAKHLVRNGDAFGVWMATSTGRAFLRAEPIFKTLPDRYLCGYCNRWIGIFPSKGIFRFHSGPGRRACRGNRERPEDTYKTNPPTK